MASPPTQRAATPPSPSASALPADAAVAYQINPAHTGLQDGDPIKPALARRWEVDLGGSVSYPLIAGGTVFVTVLFQPLNLPWYTRLYALDFNTGRSRWGPVEFPTRWAAAAYDGGRVFVQLGTGFLKAFDAVSGAALWTTRLPNTAQDGDSQSPPSAVGGTVFTEGSAYSDAVSESTGMLLWSEPVTSYSGSPAVTSAGVYLSYACSQVYDLSPANGSVVWHHTGSCTGGGGYTAVVSNGRVYARDLTYNKNLVLDSGTGAELGTFTSGPAPAIDASTGFFLDMSTARPPYTDGGTLQARDVSTGALKWTFKGDDGLKSAPIVSGGHVYIGSSKGRLYALAEDTGDVVWSDRVNFGFGSDPDAGLYPALAIGQGGLAAPFGSSLTLFTSAPTASPSAQPTSGADSAVAYQLNALHTGGLGTDPLRLPAKKLWSLGFEATPSYPLLVGDRIFITLLSSSSKLMAFNAANGSQPWPAVDLASGWALPAYDNGRIFTISTDGSLRAFTATTGTQVWQTNLPQSSFHSPPVAANGSVYVSGRGTSNGTLFAVDEQTGALRWSQGVAGGDDSAPVVTSTGVYVAYTCPHVYDFDPSDGHLIWHVGSSSCTPEAGRTPALYGGRLYVRDSHTNLILDPTTGNQLGVFQSMVAPAFSGSMAFFSNGGWVPNEGGELEGWDLATNSMVWRFDADGLSYGTSAPVVVNGTVFQTLGGNLLAIDGKTGHQVWVGEVNGQPTASEYPPGTGAGTVLGGIAAGGGYIVVPGDARGGLQHPPGMITVFGTGGTVNPPSPTPADASVTHQINPTHSGWQPNDPLTPPLTKKWSIDLGGPVSYPLIAAGRVFVTAQPAGNVGPQLYALERATGRTVWGPIALADVRGRTLLAYDNGRLFVSGPGGLRAFDAANGTEMWSRGGGGFPVASHGRLFDANARIDEETGHLIWHEVTADAGELPSVTDNGIYVTGGCEYADDLSPGDGHIVWYHWGTQCTSGGAKESVVYGGRMYLGPEAVTPPQTILDATTGAPVGTYISDTPPAFAGNLAYFMNANTLEAHRPPDLGGVWTFAGDGGLVTAPVVVNGVVYVGSTSGNLFALDAATGTLRWSGNVGAAMSVPDAWIAGEQPARSGFGAAEGSLVVSAGSRLVAYVSAMPSPSPSPSPTPSSTARTAPGQATPNPSIPPRTGPGQSTPTPSPPPRRSGSSPSPGSEPVSGNGSASPTPPLSSPFP